MVNYAIMQRELPRLRSALTRAKHSGDPRKVIAAVDVALARFNVIGWPDSWATWDAAKRDAEFQLQRMPRHDGAERRIG